MLSFSVYHFLSIFYFISAVDYKKACDYRDMRREMQPAIYSKKRVTQQPIPVVHVENATEAVNKNVVEPEVNYIIDELPQMNLFVDEDEIVAMPNPAKNEANQNADSVIENAHDEITVLPQMHDIVNQDEVVAMLNPAESEANPNTNGVIENAHDEIAVLPQMHAVELNDDIPAEGIIKNEVIISRASNIEIDSILSLIDSTEFVSAEIEDVIDASQNIRMANNMALNEPSTSASIATAIETAANIDAEKSNLISFYDSDDEEFIMTYNGSSFPKPQQPDLQPATFVKHENDRISGNKSYEIADVCTRI